MVHCTRQSPGPKIEDYTMTEITDVKDCTPNEGLITALEELLTYAKSGEMRSLVWVNGWSDDSVGHGWDVDGRNSSRRILAELMLLQHDLINDIGIKEGVSVLAKAFEVD